MTHRRPLGPGFDREHQDVADVAARQPGRTAAELAAELAADPPAVPSPAAPNGRRPLVLRPAPTPPPTAG